jgi:hypothetical protein
MSKSLMEAELIGLTDNLGFIELFQEFVEFLTGKKVNVPIVFKIAVQWYHWSRKEGVSQEPSIFMLA